MVRVVLEIDVLDQPALDQVLRGARLKTLRAGKKEVFLFSDLKEGARYTSGQAETSPKMKRKQSINGIGRRSANKAIMLTDQKRG